MTPKEKAAYLIKRFEVKDFNESTGWQTNIDESRRMAALAVSEIVDAKGMSLDTDIFWIDVLLWIENYGH